MRTKELTRTFAVTLALGAMSLPAHAHGMTLETEALFMLAVIEKCKLDQPATAQELKVSSLLWEERNQKHVTRLKTMGPAEFGKALSEAQKAYEDAGAFPKSYCQTLAEALRTPDADIKDS
jgi:hypothetical protein